MTESFDKGRAWAELNAVPFPIVEDSLIQVSPLAPFSPSLQTGASNRVIDSRQSVEIWSDFTGGIGQRHEQEAQTTSVSESTFDLRQPGAAVLPPRPTILNAAMPLLDTAAIEYLDYTTPGLLVYSTRAGTSHIGVVNLGTNVYTARPNGIVSAFVAINNQQLYLAQEGATKKLYGTSDGGASWTTVHSATVPDLNGLVALDNKLYTYDTFNKVVRQSVDYGVTWTTLGPFASTYYNEKLTQLFVWNGPGNVRDTLYALTNSRILWYEEEANEWHDFYNFRGLFDALNGSVYVHRRDNNLYFSPYNASLPGATQRKQNLVLLLNGQVSDDVSPNERFGLPADYIDGVTRMTGGAHWLYAFATGSPGGIFALNEFQGWTHLFAPSDIDASGTHTMSGGGYANGVLYAVVHRASDTTTRLVSIPVPDIRSPQPGTLYQYSRHSGKRHYLRSSWTSHNQDNRWKIGSHFVIELRKNDGSLGWDSPGVPQIEFKYRVDAGAWVTLTGLTHDAFLFTVTLPDNVDYGDNEPAYNGLAYKRIQWEFVVVGNGADYDYSPGLASVSLYYTYWQGNYYAYQFNIDLSNERWKREWPDMQYGDYDQDELLGILLGFNVARKFHTFRYKSGAQELFINRVDMLIASREDPELGGGIYSVTVRDLSV